MSSCLLRSARHTAITTLLLCSAASAFADTTANSAPRPTWGAVATNSLLPRAEGGTSATENLAPAYDAYSITEKSARQSFRVEAARSGLNRHQLTDGQSLIGWKLSETVYFGRAKKDRAAVSLVWQTSTEQRVSLSTDGVKLTRRFK